MKTMLTTILALLVGLACSVSAQDTVEITSPGLSPSHMDTQGRLVEDWGVVDIQLSGEGISEGSAKVGAITLDECIPSAQAVSDHGTVRMTRTVYRAPTYPAGVDVLTVQLKETAGKSCNALLTVKPSAGSKSGERTVRLGGRVIMVLPHDLTQSSELLDWGYCDEATSLPGWAKPVGACDAAFKNIRAGMGGVPIVYRFAVKPGSRASVMLGVCESHWAESGQRPLRCVVEGAAVQTVDPVAKWGQHKPGLLVFEARDANGDGQLEISVRSAPLAGDRNPILNAVWIFPVDRTPDADQVVAGKANAAALYYVDVGGQNDQSIYPPGKLEFPLQLPANGTQQLTFLVACPGGSAPTPDTSTWDAGTLQRAARDVWSAWTDR